MLVWPQFHRNRDFHLGQGKGLVLLPSPLIMAATYWPLVQTLAPAYSVYIPELPGTGLKFVKPRLWKDQEYAIWLRDFFHRNGLSKVILVGHSNSGAIALCFSQMFPEYVERLVLVDTIGGRVQSPLKMLFWRVVDVLLELKFSIRAAPHLFINLLLHPRNFFYQLRRSFNADLVPDLAKVRVPTALLWGKRDHTMPLSAARCLHASRPDIELSVYEKGSHDWLLTAPLHFRKVLEEWEKHSSPT